MEASDKITLELSRHEAIVLFEYLARTGEDESLRFADKAEQVALWNLEALLERELWEPFAPNWDILLSDARQALRPDISN